MPKEIVTDFLHNSPTRYRTPGVPPHRENIYGYCQAIELLIVAGHSDQEICDLLQTHTIYPEFVYAMRLVIHRLNNGVDRGFVSVTPSVSPCEVEGCNEEGAWYQYPHQENGDVAWQFVCPTHKHAETFPAYEDS